MNFILTLFNKPNIIIPLKIHPKCNVGIREKLRKSQCHIGADSGMTIEKPG
jgi:hypothetical protein